jgi:hypothetical protein
MGIVVYAGRYVEDTRGVVGHNFTVVLLLVGLGAGAYFAILFGISPRFRKTVLDNLPTAERWVPR